MECISGNQTWLDGCERTHHVTSIRDCPDAHRQPQHTPALVQTPTSFFSFNPPTWSQSTESCLWFGRLNHQPEQEGQLRIILGSHHPLIKHRNGFSHWNLTCPISGISRNQREKKNKGYCRPWISVRRRRVRTVLNSIHRIRRTCPMGTTEMYGTAGAMVTLMSEVWVKHSKYLVVFFPAKTWGKFVWSDMSRRSESLWTLGLSHTQIWIWRHVRRRLKRESQVNFCLHFLLLEGIAGIGEKRRLNHWFPWWNHRYGTLNFSETHMVVSWVMGVPQNHPPI